MYQHDNSRPGTDLRRSSAAQHPRQMRSRSSISSSRLRRLAGVARRRRGDIGGPRLTMADRCRQRARADRPGGWRRRLVVRRVLRPGAPCDGCRQDCRRRRPDAAGARAARSDAALRNQTSAPASKDVRTTFAGDHSRQPARPPSQVSSRMTRRKEPRSNTAESRRSQARKGCIRTALGRGAGPSKI